MSSTVGSDDWADLEEVSAQAGTVLLQAGDTTSRMLVLVSGQVNIEADGAVLARLREPGTIIGEMAALTGAPRSATAIAVTDVVYRRVEDPLALMEQRANVGVAVARTLAHRLHLLQSYLADVRRQYAGRSDQLGAVDAVLAALASAGPDDVEAGSDREREPNI